MIRLYSKEQWWEECLRHSPTLTRRRFNALWNAVWDLAHAMGMAEPIEN